MSEHTDSTPLLWVLCAMFLAACGRTPSYVAPSPTDGSLDAPLDATADVSTDADTGPRPDGGTSRCDAEPAAATICPEVLCDGPPQWYWNGDSCFSIECGACTGAGCAGGFDDEATCMSTHRSCDAALCRGTGGTYRWWAEECGHWECGRPLESDCLVGGPVCDCGFRRSFDPAAGCFEDDRCPVPEPVSTEELCRRSGGSWESICCHTECGAVCPEPCVGLACNCGPGKVYEDTRGCIEAARCFERSAGQSCDAPARCEAGTLCCDHCGGAGCSGTPTCQHPLCDADDTVDACGNDLLAP